jgi:hypothetical protein
MRAVGRLRVTGFANGENTRRRVAPGAHAINSGSNTAEGTGNGSRTTNAAGMRARQNPSRTDKVRTLSSGEGGIHGRKRWLIGKKAVRSAEKRYSERFGHTKLFRVIYRLLTTTGCGWPNQKAQHMGFPEKRVNRFLGAKLGKFCCFRATSENHRNERHFSPEEPH